MKHNERFVYIRHLYLKYVPQLFVLRTFILYLYDT